MTKKVRLDPLEAGALRRMAKERKMTESEVLREGLRRLERMRKRKANVEAFIEFLGDEPEPAKVKYRFQ